MVACFTNLAVASGEGWLTILERVSSGFRTALMVADTLGLERSSECDTLARSVTIPRLSIIFTMLFMLCWWFLYAAKLDWCA